MSEAEILLSALTGVLTLFSTAMGWWLISLHNRHELLRRDHEDLRVEVASKYLAKDDVRDMFDNLKQDLHALLNSFKDEMRATTQRRGA